MGEPRETNRNHCIKLVGRMILFFWITVLIMWGYYATQHIRPADGDYWPIIRVTDYIISISMNFFCALGGAVLSVLSMLTESKVEENTSKKRGIRKLVTKSRFYMCFSVIVWIMLCISFYDLILYLKTL